LVVIMGNVGGGSFVNVKCKGVLVPGREMLRLPHFLDSRLTNGGEVVSLKRRLRFTLRKISGTRFFRETESTPSPYCGWKD
jgi:hypothetical protein